MKRNEGSLRTSVTALNTPTFTLQGSQKEKREKGAENIFEDVIAENFPSLVTESIPRQDKSKEEHTEIHSNHTDKN